MLLHDFPEFLSDYHMVFCHSLALRVCWKTTNELFLAGFKLGRPEASRNARGDVIPWQCVQIRASESPRFMMT